MTSKIKGTDSLELKEDLYKLKDKLLSQNEHSRSWRKIDKEINKNLDKLDDYIDDGYINTVGNYESWLHNWIDIRGKNQKKIEFTVECGRPETISKELLKLLKNHNVTRISINPQTFCDDTLIKIGRKHTSLDTEKAFLLAKEFGFSVNADLIAGLEGDSVDEFCRTLAKAIELDPDNITVHTLAKKRGSLASQIIDKSGHGDVSGNYQLRTNDFRQTVGHSQGSSGKTSLMLDYAQKKLCLLGYRPYYLYKQKNAVENLENVGYSKKGKECLYNIDSVEELSHVFASGAGAISKRRYNAEKNGVYQRIERRANTKFIVDYIKDFGGIMQKRKEFWN
jgi:oxygen-independent coproporphyrinogen-3 oxidase